MADEKKCSVCRAQFSLDEGELPVILHCLHAVCTSCVPSLLRVTKAGVPSLTCPTCSCRSIVSGEQEEGDRLVPDEELRCKLEAKAQLANDPPAEAEICERCEDRPATQFCSTCDDSYCEKCDAKVHAKKSKKNHVRVALGDREAVLTAPSFCHHHRVSHPLELVLVCQQPGCEADNPLMCLMCPREGPHEGHTQNAVLNKVVEGHRREMLAAAAEARAYNAETVAAAVATAAAVTERLYGRSAAAAAAPYLGGGCGEGKAEPKPRVAGDGDGEAEAEAEAGSIDTAEDEVRALYAEIERLVQLCKQQDLAKARTIGAQKLRTQQQLQSQLAAAVSALAAAAWAVETAAEAVDGRSVMEKAAVVSEALSAAMENAKAAVEAAAAKAVLPDLFVTGPCMAGVREAMEQWCAVSTLSPPTDVAVAVAEQAEAAAAAGAGGAAAAAAAGAGGEEAGPWVRVSWEYAGGAAEAATTAFEVEMAVAVAGGENGDGDGDGDNGQQFSQVYVGPGTQCVVAVAPPADDADADYNAAVTVRVRSTLNPPAAAAADGGGGGGGAGGSSGWCCAAAPTVVPISVAWLPSPLLPSPGPHSQLLLQWMRQQAQFTPSSPPALLFRASAHGFRAREDFHSRADGRGPRTLTLVRATTGHVFGGFATVAWSSPAGGGKWVSAPGSFLFALSAAAEGVAVPCLMPLKAGQQRNAVLHNASYGPFFGGGHDLCIADSADANTSSGHSIGSSYALPEGAADWTFLTGGGNRYFTVADYEVYSVE